MGGWSLNSCLQERRHASRPEVDGTSSLPRAFSILRWRLATRSRTGPTSACREARPRHSLTPIVAKRSPPRDRGAARRSATAGHHRHTGWPRAGECRSARIHSRIGDLTQARPGNRLRRCDSGTAQRRGLRVFSAERTPSPPTSIPGTRVNSFVLDVTRVTPRPA